METIIVIRKPALLSIVVKSLLPKLAPCKYEQEAFILLQHGFCPIKLWEEILPSGPRTVMFRPHPHQGWAWPCCFASPLPRWSWSSSCPSPQRRAGANLWQLAGYQLWKGFPSILTNLKLNKKWRGYKSGSTLTVGFMKKPVCFKMYQSLTF